MLPIAVLFHRLGPYHHARLNSAGKRQPLVAVEFSAVDDTYAWNIVKDAGAFQRITLFHDADVEKKPANEVYQRIATTLQQIQPAVVAVPGWSSRGALAALAWCLSTSTPAVMMSDSAAHDEQRRIWKEALKRQIVRLCSAGLVGGKLHINYLVDLGVPRERIFPGYDVVGNAHFTAGAKAARKEAEISRMCLGLPDRYFLASNRFVDKKNLPRLLQAYELYRKRAGYNAWHLILLGDGPLRPQLQALISELDLSAYVMMPGFKQYDELPIYYGLASAFVHASTTEQWGLVVNEAMAAGLPVIVSERCGCAPDLVENDCNGFIFDPYNVDALADLMSKITADKCDREAMGRASQEMVRRWDSEVFGENLCKAAKMAFEAPRPRATALDKALLWTLIHR